MRKGETAEQSVARRRLEFLHHQREVLRAYARELGIPVPVELEAFFDLAQTGSWDDLQRTYGELSERVRNGEFPDEARALWPAVLETFGVIEVTHRWPAQSLLDYGQEVLGSLPPGTIFVGGTDAGRFIPTFLNATEGNSHVVLTQNSLADQSYLQYARFQYGDRINALTTEESSQAFRNYAEDAARRARHDQQFPNEPNQLRPGETVEIREDGRISMSGPVSVMAINEGLLQMLMSKNPDVPFAMEESFPFESVYGTATPNGPVLQLRADGTSPEITSERAQESVQYWRDRSASLLADDDVQATPEALTAWTKLAVAQADLLRDKHFPAEAESLFQVAQQLAPGNVEVVSRYVDYLREQSRWQDAQKVVESLLLDSPNLDQFQQLLVELKAKTNP